MSIGTVSREAVPASNEGLVEKENDDVFAGASPSCSRSHGVGSGSRQKPAETPATSE